MAPVVLSPRLLLLKRISATSKNEFEVLQPEAQPVHFQQAIGGKNIGCYLTPRIVKRAAVLSPAKDKPRAGSQSPPKVLSPEPVVGNKATDANQPGPTTSPWYDVPAVVGVQGFIELDPENAQLCRSSVMERLFRQESSEREATQRRREHDIEARQLERERAAAWRREREQAIQIQLQKQKQEKEEYEESLRRAADVNLKSRRSKIANSIWERVLLRQEALQLAADSTTSRTDLKIEAIRRVRKEQERAEKLRLQHKELEERFSSLPEERQKQIRELIRRCNNVVWTTKKEDREHVETPRQDSQGEDEVDELKSFEVTRSKSKGRVSIMPLLDGKEDKVETGGGGRGTSGVEATRMSRFGLKKSTIRGSLVPSGARTGHRQSVFLINAITRIPPVEKEGHDRLNAQKLRQAAVELGLRIFTAEEKEEVLKACTAHVQKRATWEGKSCLGCDAAEFTFEVVPAIRRRLIKIRAREFQKRLVQNERDFDGDDGYIVQLKDIVEDIWPLDGQESVGEEQDSVDAQSRDEFAGQMPVKLRYVLMRFAAEELDHDEAVTAISDYAEGFYRRQSESARKVMAKHKLSEEVYQKHQYELVVLEAIFQTKDLGDDPMTNFAEQLRAFGLPEQQGENGDTSSTKEDTLSDASPTSRKSLRFSIEDSADLYATHIGRPPRTLESFLNAVGERREESERPGAQPALDTVMRLELQLAQEKNNSRAKAKTSITEEEETIAAIRPSALQSILGRAGLNLTSREERKAAEASWRAANLDSEGIGLLTPKEVRCALSRAQEAQRRLAYKQELELGRECGFQGHEMGQLRSTYKDAVDREMEFHGLPSPWKSPQVIKVSSVNIGLTEVGKALRATGWAFALPNAKVAIEGEIELELAVALEELGSDSGVVGLAERVTFSAFVRLAEALRQRNAKLSKASSPLTTLMALRRSQLLLLVACSGMPPSQSLKYDNLSLVRKIAAMLGTRVDASIEEALHFTSFKELCSFVRQKRISGDLTERKSIPPV